MRRLRLTLVMSCFSIVSMAVPLASQGNIDWAELWRQTPPTGQPTHPFAWMNDSLSFTGLAYDQTRDLIYVVSPQYSYSSGLVTIEPRIHILGVDDGKIRSDVGRSAFPGNQGAGGELPLPLDTFIVASVKPLGFAQNRFATYKIDVDDEGRIYVCNLVNPQWGYCKQISPSVVGCDANYLDQGPLRIWRWDTPTSTPELIYATMNTSASAIGNAQDSELPATRWGDAFAVTGKRGWYDPPGPDPPVLLDSVRIYVGGGNWPGQTSPTSEIAVIVEDRRPWLQRPDRDTYGGGKLSFRLGLRIQTQRGVATHGLAPEAVTEFHGHITGNLWMDNTTGPAMYGPEFQSSIMPLPQTYAPLSSQMYTLSTSRTGLSGAMAFLSYPSYQKKYLIVADGMPIPPSIPYSNDNTTARMIDVTTQGNEFGVWGRTPQLGNSMLESIDQDNYVSDVDVSFSTFKTPVGTDEYDVRLYVLMSNNGIACYRARPTAVELSSFQAILAIDAVLLRWRVESEQSSLRFRIDRAEESEGPWEEIGSVPARGTTHEAKWYELRDELGAYAPTTNALWYRLVEEDLSGGYTVYPAVRVDLTASTAASLSMAVFPQPLRAGASGMSIRFSHDRDEDVSLRIHDVLGRQLRPELRVSLTRGSTVLPFSAGELRPGPYLIVATTASGVRRQKRILIQ